MKHSVNDIVVNQQIRSLLALKTLLVKAKEQAIEKKFDENIFLQLRLAPDMFPLVRQVQIATDTAKFAASRLSGKQAPSFPDDEKTMDEVLSRIEKTVQFLRDFSENDFADYTNKKVTFQWRPGVYMMGEDYFSSHVLPNFYFHVSMVYALLRSNGVSVGKQDYLGEQNWLKES